NRRDVQYGITGEKDAGEPFAFNGQQYAFDFTSVHFFVREKGPVRAFALGDFTINLGQGLIHWQSLAFKKSSAVTDIKRQSEVMRPYHSSGEFNFMRGVGLTLRKNFWEATIF